jgi:hypothetical protein
MFLFNWVTNSLANQQPEDDSENVHIAPKITINIKEQFRTDALFSDYTHDNVITPQQSSQCVNEHIHSNEVILADTIDDLQKRVKELELTVATLIRKIQVLGKPISTTDQEKLPVTPTATPNYAKSDEEQTQSPSDIATPTIVPTDEKFISKTKKINGVILDAFQAELTGKLEKIQCNMGASQYMSRFLS